MVFTYRQIFFKKNAFAFLSFLASGIFAGVFNPKKKLIGVY
ncbi:MAG: hypothetical protein ACJASM_000875 [Salibacteraceae bacterium]|jgi:hypothetical protein